MKEVWVKNTWVANQSLRDDVNEEGAVRPSGETTTDTPSLEVDSSWKWLVIIHRPILPNHTPCFQCQWGFYKALGESIEPWLVKVQSPFNSFPSKRSLTEPLKKTALYEHLWFVHYSVYLNPRSLSGDNNWDQLYFCYSFTFKNSSFSLLSCIDTLAKNKEMSRIEKQRNREMSRIVNFINQVLPQPLAVQQILKKHSSSPEAESRLTDLCSKLDFLFDPSFVVILHKCDHFLFMFFNIKLLVF